MDPNSTQPTSPAKAPSDGAVKTRPSDGDPSTDSTGSPQAISGQAPNPAPAQTASTEPVVAPNESTTPNPSLKEEGKNAPAPATKAVPQTATPAPKKELTIEERLEAARLAMEGPERSAGRIKRQTEEKVNEETAELSEEKDVLDKKKEKLELAWIDLDAKRGVLKKDLDPILAEEEKIESEDKSAETAEEVAGLPAQKQAAEKTRQEKDVARKAVEEKKWVIQDKIAKLEGQIDENTKQYQTLLDEEEKILTKIDELKNQLV